MSHVVALRELQARPNVLLLGDSLGDLTVADGVADHQNILTIGFLNDQVAEHVWTSCCTSNFRWLISSNVCCRWRTEENRTWTLLTSCWWRTRRWTFPTPFSGTLPHREATSKKHKRRKRTLPGNIVRDEFVWCLYDTWKITSSLLVRVVSTHTFRGFWHIYQSQTFENLFKESQEHTSTAKNFKLVNTVTCQAASFIIR